MTIPDEISDKNRRLIRQIYDGTLHPADFNVVFRAWDDYFLALGRADERLASEDFSWMDEIASHFKTAGEILDKLNTEPDLPIEPCIRTLPHAALVCDAEGRILAVNDLAAAFVPDMGGMARDR